MSPRTSNSTLLHATSRVVQAALLCQFAACFAAHERGHADRDPSSTSPGDDLDDDDPYEGEGEWDDDVEEVPGDFEPDAGADHDAGGPWSPGPADGQCHADARGRPFAAPTMGGRAYSLRAVQVSREPSLPAGVALGDVTGDGRVDLVSVQGFDLYVHVQADTGELEAPRVFSSLETDWLVDVALLDMNADGLLDIVTASEAGLGVLYALGWSEFGAYTHWIDLPLWKVTAVRDMDGDGLMDLVAESNDELYIFRAQASGGLTSPLVVPAVGAGTWVPQRCLGDLNGDGQADLVSVPRGGPVVLQAGDAQGTAFAWPGEALEVGVGENVSCAIADFNGDGLPDLAIAEDDFGYEDRAWLLTQTPAGTLRPPEVVSVHGWSGLVAGGDLNRDGSDDLVRLHSLRLSIALQTSGHLGHPVEYPFPDSSSESEQVLQIADVSCDGCPDIIAANVTGVVVFYGLGCAPAAP